MSKSSGLGDNLYIAGFDASGDISAISNVGGGPAALDFTAINKSAFERQGGLRDGRLEMTTYFNHVQAGTGTHEKLSALPRTDVILTYCRGTALGNPAACLVAKQINYDGTRATDGAFTFAVSAQANGYGLGWGQQLTAGLRTDSAATNGTSIDTTASVSFGAQAYLQVTAMTGTDATVKIQDSADNVSFADVAGLSFTQVTAAPASQRIATASGATIRRYLRAVTVTTGGFTSLTFNVVVVKNQVAVSF
ncbi:hypothetical protein AQI95_24615 [Streptomyces yokosukanensis]|uniref:Uncharacterized protein n=1 Tax=Streptomyces yokosukanensis TaxID=67386 RepID=A0A117Q1M2_9ACTN|nr:hypothetical protein [Streptomyces yokosukanensis]KUN03144.1 hypothetical protein AQI95_24615 [Streptomyces yokosukanensis]